MLKLNSLYLCKWRKYLKNITPFKILLKKKKEEIWIVKERRDKIIIRDKKSYFMKIDILSDFKTLVNWPISPPPPNQAGYALNSGPMFTNINHYVKGCQYSTNHTAAEESPSRVEIWLNLFVFQTYETPYSFWRAD